MSFDLPSWYKDFERHTFYTLFLDNLPDDFYDYLGEDGVILSGNVPESSFDREYESDWSDEGGEVSLAPPEARFPDLHAAIKKAIEELGGRVLPKLGHSAPKDGVWVSTEGTMACVDSNDIYQLLKASERISLCVDLSKKPPLSLRTWHDLDPSMEFRCFIHQDRLVAACQRNDTQYFRHLPEMKLKIKNLVEDFLLENVVGTFDSESYVCDLYLDWPVKRVYIVDFAPWSHQDTSPIMFTWEQLESMPTDGWELKIVESEDHCTISRPKTLLGPVELENMADFEFGPEFNFIKH